MAGVVGPVAGYKTLDELPLRSIRDGRVAHRNAVRLFEEMSKEGFEWKKTAEIDLSARFWISQELDQSALRVYNSCAKKIQAQKEHRQNYSVLVKEPANCGGFSLGKTILNEANPLEQMVALDHWICEKGPRWQKGRRTLCLGAPGNEYIPVYIGKRAGVDPTSMSVMLGAGKGDYKAPKYPELAENACLARTSVFKDPLDALELVRQPYFSSATLLKAGAFAREKIGARRRYEITDERNAVRSSQFACVELKGQNDTENAPTKEASSGTNLYSLVKHHRLDPINKNVLFEEFVHEGYDDDAEVKVTPQSLWDATEKSVCWADSSDLDLLMERLFISHVGKFSSPVVTDYYTRRIFPPKGDS